MSNTEAGYDLDLAEKMFPVGTKVRIAGSEDWPKKQRILNGLIGTVHDVVDNGDGTVCLKIKLRKNQFGRKKACINASWIEHLTALELLAEV